MKMILATLALGMCVRMAESIALAEHLKSHALREVQRMEREAQGAETRRRKPLPPPPPPILSPVEKVIKMLDNLQAKVIKEEKEQWLLYDQETALCHKDYKALSFLVKEDEMHYRNDEAVIACEGALVIKLFTRIDQLMFLIAQKEQELGRLNKSYANESSHYNAELKDLRDTVNVLTTAIKYIEDAKPSLLQANRTFSLAEALEAMVKAHSVSIADSELLSGFIQSKADSATQVHEKGTQGEDDASPYRTPPPGQQIAYNTKTGDILDTLNSLLDTAEESLRELEKTTTDHRLAHEEVVAKFMTEITGYQEELEQRKKDEGWHEAKKKEMEHDLYGISKTLSIDKDARVMTKQECMDAANAFLEESDLRKAELQALVKGEAAVQGANGSSAGTAGSASFMQLKSDSETTESTDDGASDVSQQVVQFMRELGHEQKSKALLQFSSRLANVVRHSEKHREDPFAKVKGMISDMLAKLQAEAAADASRFAICQKGIEDNEAETKEKEALFDQYDAQLDAATAEMNKVKMVISALAASAASAAEMEAQQSELRAKMHALYTQQKGDDTAGLAAVRQGITIIEDFYGSNTITNEANQEGATNIVALLQVIEQDLIKSLEILEATETKEEEDWDEAKQQYSIERAQNEKDTKAYQSTLVQIEQTVSEQQANKDTVLDRLKEIHLVLVGLRKDCVASPAVEYKEKVAKMQAEIDGLKRGLDILEGETVLLQGPVVRKRVTARSLRGLLRH